MSIKRIIAIVRVDMLQPLEARLKRLQVGGVTVSRVKGYGGYKNLYTTDWMSDHAKIEIFVDEGELDALIEAMREVAHANPPETGIVAVLPVERFLHLRTGADTASEAPRA